MDMIHTYAGETIRFEIKYKNRKSFRITFDHYGYIEVQAPKGTPDERIRKLLEEKWELIQQNLNEIKERLRGPQEKSYEHGDSFLYLGSSYPIRIFQDGNIEQDYVVFRG
jgi:predicted metal-dependent hydrolase